MQDSFDKEKYITAKKRALYLLGGKDYSEKELMDKLLQNYPEEICREVVEAMREYGYINDERYTEKLYEAYKRKGWGKPKIRFELKRRGISEHLILLKEQEYEHDDYIEDIIQFVNKKYKNKLDFEDYDSVRRVTAALVRRGFSYDDVKTALNAIKEDIE